MPTQTAPGRFTLGLDVNLWNEITRLAGLVTESEQANAIGIARGTLNRVRNGRAAPGPEFIAAVRERFPSVDFGRLFPTIRKAA